VVDVGHGGRRVMEAVWIRAERWVGICALGTGRCCMFTTEMGDEVMVKRPALLSTSAVVPGRCGWCTETRRHPLADEYLPSSQHLIPSAHPVSRKVVATGVRSVDLSLYESVLHQTE